MLKKQLQILLLAFLVHTGIYGQSYALDFDGTNDYVTILDANVLDITGDITLEAWIKLDNISGNKIILLKSLGGNATDMSYALRVNDDELKFELAGGSGDFDGLGNVYAYVATTNYNISTGVWYHVAGTRSGSSIVLYINGVSVATKTISTNNILSSNANVVLGYFPGYPQYFNGQMDEVRIWSNARTASEISGNMNMELRGDESNLVAYYKMNTGSGTSLTDNSSNSNTGTLTNMDAADWVTGVSMVAVINPFVTTWQTDASTNVTIPLTGSGYDFDIDWGDGTIETKTGSPGNISHTYATAGVKTVSITANITTGFPRIYVNNFGNRNLLKTVESWGSGIWGTGVDRSFLGAANLEINATDTPNFSQTTNFQYMFLNCTSLTGANGFANWTLNTNTAASVSFSNMFNGATLFNGSISNWDVSRVTNFESMFLNAQKFNQNISSWNVSNVTTMVSMFQSAKVFNQDISTWNVANVTSMSNMFYSAAAFNINISIWNVGNVLYMNGMFQNTALFNQDLSNWDVSKVINMESMFNSAVVFNSPLNWGIKTGNVANMNNMFRQAPLFNQDINGWDVSKVTTTNLMFYRTNNFNQDLNSWNVSSLTNPSQMFQECTSFNGNISSWQFTTDPAKSINMSSMFLSATSFNQNISAWNVVRVTNMTSMFLNAIVFNQNISSWNVSNVTTMASMFQSAKVFNQDISIWNVANVTSMSNMFYSAAAFNINISIWNVGNVLYMNGMFQNTALFNQDLSNWNVSKVINMDSMFNSAVVFNSPLNWGIKTGNVANMNNMFRQAPLFNQDINGWDVSKVTTTNLMFYRTNNFNQDLNSWNVSSLTNPSQMFQECTSFNGNISSWVFTTDPAKNVNASSMFQNATAFNQNISNWNVVRFTSMSNMFLNATSFNQNIGSWNVANVTNMVSMFNNANVFAQDISGWNVGNVTNMSSMFQNADAFNIDISGWNVGNVLYMNGMFQNTALFNQDLSNWNVSKVINMDSMFWAAIQFNSPLIWGVKTGNVANMNNMFRQAPLFNQDINGWDVSKVTTTVLMFYQANSFNQDLNSWNVSSLTNPSRMFESCSSFNGNISSWQFTTDPAKSINMSSMFLSATSFNQNISAWNISRVTNLVNFLNGGKLSRENYDALLVGWSTLVTGESQIPTGLNAHFGSSKYSNTSTVVTARDTELISNKSWTITDGGVDSDFTLPLIASNSLALDNTTISITFSEAVYRRNVGSGTLEIADFLFAINGGTATPSSTTPISITSTNNLTFVLGIGLTGTPNGNEILTVTPVLNAVFDASGNVASTTQTNNTAQLHDLSVPVITGPNGAVGLTSVLSFNENQTTVFGFTADKAVSWSLGSSNDEALFALDASGTLIFNSAPDFETPLSSTSSNTYLVEVIVTDSSSNVSTQTLTITIVDVAAAAFTTFSPITKTFFDDPFSITPPVSSNSSPITFTSSNTAVATVSGTTVTNTGIGSTLITAYQGYDATYDENTATATLTVIGVSVLTKNGAYSNTDANYIDKNGKIGGGLGISKSGEIKSTLTITDITDSVAFQTYYDLELGTSCNSCFMGAPSSYDLKFAAGGGTIRARMWWNEQYSDMAMVYDKSFENINITDINNYYFCDYIGDSNNACINVDTPPTNFTGIYRTNEGNYYAVQYISEISNEVTFKYKKLN